MKNFDDIKYNLLSTKEQLDKFGLLLKKKKWLSERDDILPFFKENQHLSAYIGTYHINIFNPNKIAYEYDLFGDFKADLVVGQSSLSNHCYCFIEFEDATENSIFNFAKNRAIPEWGTRFEKGFSQIIDWFWKLEDVKNTQDFEYRFQSRTIDYMGLLIIGRNQNLNNREINRLKWRQNNLIINSKRIYCMTFDELFDNLNYKLENEVKSFLENGIESFEELFKQINEENFE